MLATLKMGARQGMIAAVLAALLSSTVDAKAPSRSLLLTGGSLPPITVPFNNTLQPKSLPLPFDDTSIVRIEVGYQPEQVCSSAPMAKHAPQALNFLHTQFDLTTWARTAHSL